MKKIITITCWILLFNFVGVHAQKYTDSDIGFESENIRQELLEHGDYTLEQVASKLKEARAEYVQYHQKKLDYLKGQPAKVFAPIPITSCANMDFSQNTNAWTANASRLNYNTRPSLDVTNNSWGQQGAANTGTIFDPITNISRFQVMPANTIDPRLNSAINPNAALGSNVMLLGNAQEFLGGSNMGQEEISKRFVLTNQNSVLQYGYAIVFERPTHAIVPNSFDIFISVNGVPLNGCSAINFNFNTAQMGNGFIPSALDPNDLVRPWATNTIDLLSIPNVQLGDVIGLSFRNRDCGLGGHGSYAYVTAQCLPNSEAITVTSVSGDICVNEPLTFSTNVDILVGATTQWQILEGNTVLATVSNGGANIPFTFTQAGTYTVNFTMTSPGGCTINSSTDITITNCCIDCSVAGSNIFNGIYPVKNECGTYQTKIASDILECYTVQIYKSDNNNGWVTIASNDVINDIYEFNFTENGNYTIAIRLIDPATGKVCFIKRKTLKVNCCLDCDNVGNDIFNSLTETEDCGNYTVDIPFGTLDCYEVEIYQGGGIGWNTISSSDLNNNIYAINFTENGNYTIAIRLIDPATGKVCYYDKKSVGVQCSSSICVQDPILENLLANNLKNILNAILNLENGFTGSCASGNNSTRIDITSMPEVTQFMQAYDLESRLQNAIDLRENQPNNSYPYYTADITNVYYKWGYSNPGYPPCLRITFANQGIGQIGPSFSYYISGGFANGAPVSQVGLNPTLIQEFTSIVLNAEESKATYNYIDTNGQTNSLYDILWATTRVEGVFNGLRYCWFHDLDYVPVNGLIEAENELILYPNPASDAFTVSFADKEKIEGYQVSIRTMIGKLVHQSRSISNTKISVQKLPPGIYFVSVLTDSGKSYQKQLIVK